MAKKPAAPPAHPDLAVVKAETGFSRFLQLDVVRFRQRLFSGEWSGERVYDVLRRGDAVAVLLYDPDRDSVVLVEQFRLPPLYAGFSPWQIEPVAGLVDEGESYEAVARRETREEADIFQVAAVGEFRPQLSPIDEGYRGIASAGECSPPPEMGLRCSLVRLSARRARVSGCGERSSRYGVDPKRSLRDFPRA